jgi:hypothetical protein
LTERQRIEKATKLAEKLFEDNINVLKCRRDYIKNVYSTAFCANRVLGGGHFPNIIHNALEAESIEELTTLTEKMYKRANNISHLQTLCDLDRFHIKDANIQEKIEVYNELTAVIEYQIMPFETFWAMEYRVNNWHDIVLADRDIYKYMKSICETYLTDTQEFDNLLEECRQEQCKSNTIIL